MFKQAESNFAMLEKPKPLLGSLGRLVIFLWALLMVMLPPLEKGLVPALIALVTLGALYPFALRRLTQPRWLFLLAGLFLLNLFFGVPAEEKELLILGLPVSSVAIFNGVQMVLRAIVILLDADGLSTSVDITEVAGLLEVSDFGPGRSPGLAFLDGEEMPWVPAFEKPESGGGLVKEIGEIFALEEYQSLISGYADRVLAVEGGADETARLELAKSIGFMDPASPLVDRLEPLLRDSSPRVFHMAAESAAALGLRSFAPLLIRGLADPRTSDDAAAALARFGAAVSGTLADVLLDSAEALDVRRAAARLLGRTGSREAVKPLLSVLDAEGENLGDDALDALDDLRTRSSLPALPEDAALRRIDRMLGRVSRAATVSGFLPVFKLLGLVYDHEDIFRAYQNLLQGTRDATAYALELLDQIAAPEIKAKLFPRIERLSECGGDG